MVSYPVQGIRHPSVGIDICLFVGSKKKYIMAILFAPSWEPVNKKFFLASSGYL
jgi:hypothetical protein